MSETSLDSLHLLRRLHVRLTLLYGGAMLISLLLLGFSLYNQGVSSETRNLQQRLLAAVQALAQTIDADALGAVPPGTTQSSHLHRSVLLRLNQMAKANGEITSLYVLRPTQEPTKLRFFADVVKHGRAAAPGEIYDASSIPTMLQGFGRAIAEREPVRDRFGHTLSGYAPVRNSQGRSVALVGADVDASRLHEIRRQVLHSTVLSLVMTLPILGLIALVVAHDIRTPLSRLIKAASAISEGDLSIRVDLRRSDELGLMSHHFDHMADQLQDRDFIRETFGCYLSHQIASEVLRQRSGPSLGGEERVVTVLFSDLRGYASLSEKLSAHQVVTMLNQYLGAMTELVHHHNGCVIEFVGDAIFAVFGAPHYIPDHAERGMRCALDMLACLETLNANWDQSGLADSWHRRGIPDISIRIGLHSGSVIAGNLGSKTRMKYSVIGDTVNVASRLEELNKLMGSKLLLSHTVFSQLPAELCRGLSDRGRLRVKGRHQVVRVYALHPGEPATQNARAAAAQAG